MIEIVGNGMIASAFRGVHFDSDCLLLASGVSNSLESMVSEFQREKDVVLAAIARCPESRVVYFSTCSIYGATRSPYVEHKLQMEEVVMAEAKSCLILRLPQIVGLTRNSTLVSYFVEQILRGNTVYVQTDATRNLIDVCDVVRVTKSLLQVNHLEKIAVNLAAKHSVTVLDIVCRIAEILGASANCVEVSGGEAYPISIDYIESFLCTEDSLFDEKYWGDTLEKYVPLLAKRETSDLRFY